MPPVNTKLAWLVASVVAMPAPMPLAVPMFASVVTATVPPVSVKGWVKVFRPVSESVPVPDFVKAMRPVPSWMTPETTLLPLPVPTLSVEAVADELVIVPALVSAPTVLRLTPFMSNVVPWRSVSPMPEAPSVVVAPSSWSLPSLTVTAPPVVSALTALRMSVPAPFLVIPPVVVAVTGAESVRMSEAPLTRMTRSPADAVVTPVPVMDAPVVAPSTKMPPPVAPPTVNKPVSVRALLPEILSEVTARAPVDAAASIATFVAAVRVLTVVKPIVVP